MVGRLERKPDRRLLGGVSRNAVIGKVHRLALPGRAKAGGTTATPARAKRPAAATAPRAATFAAARPAAAQRTAVRPAGAGCRHEGRVEFDIEAEENCVGRQQCRRADVAASRLNLLTDRTCKWPIGDPMKEEFHFCGNDSPDTSPYCTFHAKLAYQPSAEAAAPEASFRACKKAALPSGWAALLFYDTRRSQGRQTMSAVPP